MGFASFILKEKGLESSPILVEITWTVLSSAAIEEETSIRMYKSKGRFLCGVTETLKDNWFSEKKIIHWALKQSHTTYWRSEVTTNVATKLSS